ncbi:uncharacterized protein B0P05DRAFT_542890 [Gilbertella persicaria]|uniref:uncharacterized protein n=1 Tax=Gilbertella persicaria TaxID=101096 RepID=UPI00221F97FB|nr:uncharacterized protein B0P05DRAFT_542890 [Gilbertella persicaria]KAI8078194.1 hypothetical protein B0P05DRAFT_542890 [Gilbertella persicaria]
MRLKIIKIYAYLRVAYINSPKNSILFILFFTLSNMFNKSIIFFFFFVLTFVNAIVINPKITSPTTGTKWRAGGTFTVKWETTYFDGSSNVPIPDTQNGRIMLGYLENNDPYNEHLKWTLATNFPLNSGAQQITLPSDLSTRTSYIIVLMGDSGNASNKFTIQAAK